MKNQKVPTWLGTAIIIIFAITVGMLTWKCENNKFIKSETINSSQGQKKVETIAQQQGNKHGCKESNGYFWCEKKQNCVQNWDENCPSADVLNISDWEEFDSMYSSKFHFSFKYPKSWFNPSDEAGDSFQSFPFYSKDNYTNTCQKTDRGSTECKETGRVALVSIFSSTFVPREVKYENSKSHPITVDGYKGSVTEGTVNDLKGGTVAENGKAEITAFFPEVKGMHFRMTMKLENDTERSVFNQAISTIKF